MLEVPIKFNEPAYELRVADMSEITNKLKLADKLELANSWREADKLDAAIKLKVSVKERIWPS